jgi:hypothetical protein
MKKNLLFTAVTAIFFLVSQAQDQPKFGIDFSGFVKTDIIWDSRQNLAFREGHFLLFPLNEQLDANGDDINKKTNFNFLNVQTRLLGKISGPDALGAKTSGLIEAEFFGTSDADVNGFRLRHAFVKLNWTKTELMVGQFWHPLFNVNCFPGVVSFNTGAPFTPFTRNPQIRLTQKLGNHWNVSLAALSQRDFVSNGPDGPSSKYLRNTGIPAANLQFEYGMKNQKETIEVFAGLMGNYKMLTPRIVTTANVKTNEKVNSFTIMGYAKARFWGFTIKIGEIFTQDAHDLTMLGGYAVKDVTNAQTMEVDYVASNVYSQWIEYVYAQKKWEIGLFTAYSKNLGYVSDLTTEFSGDNTKTIYARGANIDHLYRIAPRFVYNAGKFRIAPEIEYTVAGYGTIESDGTVKDPKDIGNFRLLIGVYYFF